MAQFLPDNIKSFFKRCAVRMIGTGVVVLSLGLAGALISYDPRDPSFNTATGNLPLNWLGYRGAAVSDLLWQYFGLAALLFPVSLFAWGILIFRLKAAHYQLLKRVVAFFPTLYLLLILFSAMPVQSFTPLVAGYAGAVMPSFYHPFISYLKAVYLPYPEALLLPFVFVTAVFGLAATLGIPFRLLKVWFFWLMRVLKKTSLLVRPVKNREITENIDELPDVPPESVFEDQELPLPAAPVIPKTTETKPETKPVRVNTVLTAVKEKRKNPQKFQLPTLDFLTKPKVDKDAGISRDYLEKRSRQLESVLAEYGVNGKIVAAHPGPVVTLFELEPAPGIKTTRVINLADDIARSMSALSVRIAVIPGQSVIGIEMPNEKRADVYLREMFANDKFKNATKPLLLALGKDIGGEPTFADLAKMPHLLVAGTTGSGKSVAINTMILSLVYRLSPEEVRLILVDPKMLELSVYNGIPHLLTPVVTEPKKAVVALNWAVREMDDRYKKMSEIGVRNIDGYNTKIKEMKASGKPAKRTVLTGYENGEPIYEEQDLDLNPFPYIVVIVDEMADLMVTAGKEIEVAVQRIAQKARAAGIHLIVATQRPSVDVITGTIKANFPERVSFRLTTKIDSRTILNEQGAEQLLGRGDMLYLAQGQRAVRLHGPFVSDEEVEKITAHLRLQGVPNYVQAVTEEQASDGSGPFGADGETTDESNSLYDQAVAVVLRDRKVSTSYIQRQLRIGYNRAADLIDQMEREGVISPANHVGKREILVPDNR